MPNEADTCRNYILPKLHAVGWTYDAVTEQLVQTQVPNLNNETSERRMRRVTSEWGKALRDLEKVRKSVEKDVKFRMRENAS